MEATPVVRARAVYEGTEGTLSVGDGALRFEHAGTVVGDVPLSELTGYRRRRLLVGFTVQQGDRPLTFDLLTPLVADKKRRGPAAPDPTTGITPFVTALDSGCRATAKGLRRAFERVLPHAPPA